MHLSGVEDQVAERRDRMCPRAVRAHKLQERGLSCMRLQRVMVVQRTYALTSDVRVHDVTDIADGVAARCGSSSSRGDGSGGRTIAEMALGARQPISHAQVSAPPC